MEFAIVDTSSILFGFANRKSVFDAVGEELGVRCLISKGIIRELERISEGKGVRGATAQTALKEISLKRIKKEDNSEYPDAWILKRSRSGIAAVVTNDTKLAGSIPETVAVFKFSRQGGSKDSGEEMYYVHTLQDTFKMAPEFFDRDIEDVATMVLKRKYEGAIDKKLGVVVSVFNIRNIGDGAILPGDPATHHQVEFDMLTYMPYVDEVVAGEVTELAEFGAFVRIGPIEGLVHVSQITNDFLTFDKKVPAFVSKRSGRSLKKGDSVLAKISTVSMKNTVKDSKIALTMKPEGLGKAEWITENVKRARSEAAKRRR